MKYLAVHQDFAHHVQSEPVAHIADVVLFPWPIALPEGFERISTPLIDADKLEAFRAHWEAVCPNVPPVNPQPIPEPQPEPEDELEN
jgi:hypothetical protein